MSTSPIIRFVTSDDYIQWLPLWNAYNEFYGRVNATALPNEITQITWARFLDESEPMYAMVAESNGKLIGLVHYLFHRSTILLNPNCYLQDLFVAETGRSQGIGKTLIQAVYEQAKQAGSVRVYWHTHESNTTAMQLYDKVAKKTGFLVYSKTLV